MQVHTSKPAQFMAQVERNLITPLTSTANNNNAASLIGGGASVPTQNLLTPLGAVAPSSAASALGLLSALYSAGNGLLSGSSPIAPTPTLHPASVLPDVGAFKEV